MAYLLPHDELRGDVPPMPRLIPHRDLVAVPALWWRVRRTEELVIRDEDREMAVPLHTSELRRK